MSFKSTILLYFLLLALSVCHLDVPSLVLYKGKPVSEVLTKMELPKLFGETLSNILDAPMNWEYIDKGRIYDQYLRINNIVVDNSNSSLDISRLVYNILSDGEVLTGKTSFKVQFKFDYEAKTGIRAAPKGTGYIVFNSVFFEFKKVFSLQNDHNSVNATATVNLISSRNYTGFGSDATLDGYFERLLNVNTQNLALKVASTFQNTINQFYKNQSDKQSLDYPVSVDQNTNYTLDLAFTQNPLYDIGRGVIYYHCGEVQKEIDAGILQSKGFLKSKGHKKWDNFSPSEGNFQIFISSFVLEQIVNDLSETQMIQYNYTSLDLPINTNFRISVEFLGQIIPDVYKTFARDQELVVGLTLSDLKLNMKDKLVGETTLQYNIFKEDKVLLSFDIQSEFSLSHDFSNHKLNFKVDGLSIKDITITNNQYGILDEAVLRAFSFDSLKNHLSFNPYYFFKKHVDFSKFFIESKVKVIENEGILIAGSANIAFDSSAPQNLSKDVIQMIKNSL